ncbi:MAG: DnaD domain protein, partial [Clostridia bacterium]
MPKRTTVKSSTDNFFLVPQDIFALFSNISLNDLKVLLYIYANKDFFVEDAVKALCITPDMFESSLAFCRGTGLLSLDEEKISSIKSSAPSYDSEVIAEALQTDKTFKELCRIIGEKTGKNLPKNDYNVLFQMYSFDGMSCEYILSIAEYAKKRGKPYLGYIKSTAYALCSEGIDNYEKLETYFAERDKIENSQNKLRQLLGFGERALTTKERAYFTRWFDEYSLSFDLVAAAYEIMIDTIGAVKLPYMSKILEDWHTNGYETPEDVKKEKPKSKKDYSASSRSESFDSDEFFEIALKKGLED